MGTTRNPDQTVRVLDLSPDALAQLGQDPDSDSPWLVALFGTYTKATVTVTAAGDTTVVAPGAGQRVRLFKFAYSADGGNATGVVVGLRFGAGPDLDRQWLDPRQPYADSLTGRWIDGGTDEPLVVDLSAGVTPGVYVNVGYQLVA